MDKFSDLEAFVTVVDSGSFSAAGERLETAKSAVSRRVSTLEQRLGVKLLNRTTRRLSLTEAGRAFHERATRILADLDEAEQAVGDSQSALSGQIRLAAPLSFGLQHLSPALNQFSHTHPEVQLHIDLNDRQVNIVEEGFDLAVRIGQLEDSSLIARRLCPIRFVTVASQAYLEQYGTPETPQQLSQHRGLRYSNSPRPTAWSYVGADGVSIQADVPDQLVANNGEILTQAALDGLGIAKEPSFIAYQYLLDRRLQRILTDYKVNSVNLYVMFPPGRYMSRRVRALADFLLSYFGSEPYWDRLLAELD